MLLEPLLLFLAYESDDSLATDNDSDGEEAARAFAETEEVFVEACAQGRLLEKGAAMGDDASMPAEGVYLNRVPGTAHMLHASDETKSACGLWMNPLCYECVSDEFSLLGCTLCWRSGCGRWVAKPPDADDPVPTEAPSDNDVELFLDVFTE